jgi:hypothetical protein
VATTGDIPNAASGIFMRGYVTDAPEIDLQNSVDFDEVRTIARGTATESDCDGVGTVGLYTNVGGGWDPIGIAGTGNRLNLGLFDFWDDFTQAPDTIITYNGNPVTNTITGDPLLRNDFNGVIYFEGDGRVLGTMDGVSAHSITVYCTDDAIMDGDIVTGHTGFDPITRLPTTGGDPVNIGIVASDYVYVGNVSRVVQFDVAMMAVGANWRALDSSTGAHPAYVGPPRDLDMDGLFGEAPWNHDPDPGTGWNEAVITAGTWVININGPIITHDGGSAAPWSNGAITAAATGPTRRYNYDLDVTEFPPPCYPVPLNLWIDVSWTEIFEADETLWSHLP